MDSVFIKYNKLSVIRVKKAFQVFKFFKLKSYYFGSENFVTIVIWQSVLKLFQLSYGDFFFSYHAYNNYKVGVIHNSRNVRHVTLNGFFFSNPAWYAPGALEPSLPLHTGPPWHTVHTVTPWRSLYGWMNEWMFAWMNGSLNEWMYVWINESLMNISMNKWITE